MLPPEISDGTISGAERSLFRKLRADLPDDWTVLHSLGLAGHETKPWAEIDFVLIGPKGLFCLEVKGGRVARHDGQWLFTDRHGRVRQKAEGPFDQVAEAAAALTRFVKSEFPQIRDAVVGHGVATPDVVFDMTGPDIEEALVYDIRDAARGFGPYLERLAARWRHRLDSQRRRPMRDLSGEECRRLVDLLRGDFELVPSLRTRVGQANQELLRLTQEQYHVLDGLAENDRVLVRGGAGTGKTLLAIEEARRQARAGRRVFLFCFNRQLAAFLAGTVKDETLIRARHLHGFMSEEISRAGLIDRLPHSDEANLFTIIYPQVCIEALVESSDPPECDVLIIDEAQDLLREGYVEVFDLILKGGLARGMWRAFLDPNQNIFQGVNPSGMQRLQDAHPTIYRLTENCRNTAPIANSAAMLSGIKADKVLAVSGPEVETYWYRDAGMQTRQVSRHVNRLLSEGLHPADIVLLSLRKLHRSGLAPGLQEVPYKIWEFESSPPAPRPALRFSTIAGFKGLEADAVVIVDLDDLSSEKMRSALYVGASRARVLLSLFINEEARPAYEKMKSTFDQQSAQGC
jgi:hypothetical protein